jgi:N4-acetylcytidine amidohydrolase
MFKKEFLPLILSGRKTQTRRTHKRQFKVGKVYSIQINRTTSTGHYLRITKRYSQRLGQITEDEAHQEGFNSLEEFRHKWINIYGSWEPEQVIVVYEFIVIDETKRATPDKSLQSGKQSE